jgi:hypothetical protein
MISSRWKTVRGRDVVIETGSANRRLGLAMKVLGLAAARGLVVGGAALLIVHAVGSGPSTTVREAKAFLTDIRNEKYSQAYDRLCQADPNLAPRDVFVTGLSQARKRGHGIDNFQIGVTFTKETAHLTSATGTVTFLDGKEQAVTFDIRPSTATANEKCIVYGDDLAGI